jgi:hypothetical protein
MSQAVTLNLDRIDESTRSWSLIHAGEIHPMSWTDGERLLALSTEVREGAAEPQDFSFQPHGETSAAAIILFVTADEPFELLTIDDRQTPPLISY